MIRRSFDAPLGAIIVVLMVAVAVSAQDAAARKDADAARKKFADILAAGDQPASKTPKAVHRTTVTERELNAYLASDGAPQLPAGVVDPSVNILGAGRVSGRAVVDLDAVRKSNPPTGLLDPRTLLRGHLPVTATGVLKTGGGEGRFELESATVGGIPIPKLFLQEIVSYYSKSPEKASGVSLDDPFDLPAGIREIQVQTGQAVVVQ
jgi:hypothetical protein